MLYDLCNPLTIRIMGLGRPLHEAERIAAMIVVWVIMICAMTGCTISIAGVPEREPDRGSGSRSLSPVNGTGRVRICGIFPVFTGTATDNSRSFLHTQ